uniref:Zinc transporter ZIP9 n=1 Tax=Lygus hesperus TaxID=30085 RepID=A0A0A9ZF22_LYGHE
MFSVVVNQHGCDGDDGGTAMCVDLPVCVHTAADAVVETKTHTAIETETETETDTGTDVEVGSRTEVPKNTVEIHEQVGTGRGPVDGLSRMMENLTACWEGKQDQVELPAIQDPIPFYVCEQQLGWWNLPVCLLPTQFLLKNTFQAAMVSETVACWEFDNGYCKSGQCYLLDAFKFRMLYIYSR